MTNFERIKAMDIDELAALLESAACRNCAYHYLSDCRFKPCIDGVKAWLEQAAEE